MSPRHRNPGGLLWLDEAVPEQMALHWRSRSIAGHRDRAIRSQDERRLFATAHGLHEHGKNNARVSHPVSGSAGVL